MNIIKNSNFRPGRNCGQRTEKIRYIVIHYTGSEGTARDNVNYFNNGNRGASAHYFVDRSGEIREYCDPAKYYAWHCGGSLESGHHPLHGKCTNRNSIGIEICTHYNGAWIFTAAAVNAAAELTKYLMQKYNVPADRVCRHYDVTGKACPRVPGWGPVGGSGEWNKFKARLGGAAAVLSLSKGDSGADVKKMQEMLIACGYSCGSYGADGDWGDSTEAAVLSFQGDHGLAVDGVFGPKTRAALEAAYKAAKEKAEKKTEDTPAPVSDGGAGKKEEKKQEEKKETAEPRKIEIRFYYPGYTRHDSPDDRQGAGCIWHDQDGHVLIYDAYMKDSEPAKKMIQYLRDNGLTDVDTAVLSHAHVDHGGGIIRMFESGIKVKNFLCYDPASLKLAGTGSGNARGVLEDKQYLQGLIALAKRKGAAVRYIDDGDTVTCGDMYFEVYRDQPDHFTPNDGGFGWAYTNDGSLCLYETRLGVLLLGDADGSRAADHCGVINVVEAGHHGNNGTESKAKKFKSKGCRLAIECNNEKNGPGSCDFTHWCARRLIEAGIEVWMLNANIYGRAVTDKSGKTGKLYVKQGKKSRSFNVTFTEPGKDTDKKTDPAGSFLIRVKCEMNIRRGPSINNPADRTAKPGVYTITETDGDWGRLKAGGWIYLANSAWVERI